MEIINKGSDDMLELQGLDCCFPAGTMSTMYPEGE